jgi:DNA-binding XRE family transcriptional regulator
VSSAEVAYSNLATKTLTTPAPPCSILATMRQSGITQRVAARIAQLRDESGLSQEALATKAGINRVTLARLERALHEPSLQTLERLARALNATLEVTLTRRSRRTGGS